MTDKPEMIPLEDADLASLRHYATTKLGLEAKHGANANTYRAQIRTVEPDCVAVPAVPIEAPRPAATPITEAVKSAKAPPAPYSLGRPENDPKVRLKINKTTEKHRSRDVTVRHNGKLWRLQRGVEVEMPYRVFLVLRDAKERAPIPTDQSNPVTGEPIMAWEEIHSYPYELISMPSEQEIAEWHEATREGFGAKAA